MNKSNYGFGTVVITFFVTIVLVLIAVAGGAYLLYTSVKVKSIASLFESGDTIYISDDYDETISGLVSDVSSSASDGTLCLDDLIEISPYVDTLVDSLIDYVEATGFASIDKDALCATPLSSLTSSLTDFVIITASLSSLSSSLGFSLPDMPLLTGGDDNPCYFYTLANDNDTGDIEKEFSLSDEYTYYTGSSAYTDTYTDDDGNTIPIVSWEENSFFTLSGVTLSDSHLTYEGYPLYLSGGDDGSYESITENSTALYSLSDGTAVFLLADDEHIFIRETETVYTALSLGEATETVYTPIVASRYKYTALYYCDESAETYISANTWDGSQYETDSELGGFLLSVPGYETAWDGYWSQPVTLYAEETVYSDGMTLDEAQSLIETAQTAGETVPSVYVRTDGIADLPILFAMDALSSVLDMDALTLNDLSVYTGLELVSSEDSGTISTVLDAFYYIPLSYLSSSGDAELMQLTLGDVLSIDTEDESTASVLAALADTTIGDLENALYSITIGDLIPSSSSSLIQAVSDWTITDFSNTNKLNSLTLGDILDIDETDESTAAILLSLKDVSIGDLTDTVNTLTIEDLLGSDALESSPVLSALRNSTLETLADDIQSLSLQTLFSDYIYEYYAVDVVGDEYSSVTEIYETYKDIYGEDNLYIVASGTYILYSEATSSQISAADTLYSPYLLLTEEELSSYYSSVPLYVLSDGEMVLATETTGWVLTAEQQETYADITLYTAKDESSAVSSLSDVFTVSTLYYWDISAEAYKSVSLTAATYEIAEEYASAQYFFARLSYQGTASAETLYTYENLYYYDIASHSWTRLSLAAAYVNAEDDSDTTYYYFNDDGDLTNGVTIYTESTDSDGNTVYTDGTVILYVTYAGGYVLTEDVDASTAVYSYGNVAGLWKYLLYDTDGVELDCTLDNFNDLTANLGTNINNATLYELVADGIVTVTDSSVLDKTLAGKSVGEYTVSELLDALSALLS